VNPGKILLVEDNPDDVALTMRALKSHNITNDVIVVDDGVQAVEYLLGAKGRPGAEELPAVVLLDLKLPRLDGLVVILTSSDEERDIVKGYRLGANSYVRKPVDFMEFTEAAKQLGLYWLLMNRAPPVSRTP